MEVDLNHDVSRGCWPLADDAAAEGLSDIVGWSNSDWLEALSWSVTLPAGALDAAAGKAKRGFSERRASTDRGRSVV